MGYTIYKLACILKIIYFMLCIIYAVYKISYEYHNKINTLSILSVGNNNLKKIKNNFLSCNHNRNNTAQGRWESNP